MALIEELKAYKDYQKRLEQSKAFQSVTSVSPVYGDPDGPDSGRIIGYKSYVDPDSGAQPVNIDAKYVGVTQDWHNEGNPVFRFDKEKYLADTVGQKPKLPFGSYAETLKKALDSGVDLRPLYGETYADAVQFKQDLGQYAGKDQSMIIPANPVGYGGQFKFDPNFGSAYYRDLAMEAGKSLGLAPEQIMQKGSAYFADKFASGANTKGIIGFADLGKGLLDEFATTAGVPADKLEELRGTALKPLYDANQKVFQGLNGAARIESQSSGFFKGIGEALSGLGPIGTIGLGLALGPAGLGLGAASAGAVAGGLGGLLQGDLSSAIKGAAIGGIGGGALKGLNSLSGTVSEALGGGALGNIAGNAATGALKGGIGSLIGGGDLKTGLLGGALGSGVNTAIGEGLNAFGNAVRPDVPAGTGLTPGAAGQGLQLDSSKFGPNFNLPDTTGYLDFTQGIGGLFDGMNFAQLGLNPGTVGNQDFSSGIGQGLQTPSSPTLSGQLGQGLTVGTPGGRLDQGGITPTGQINLGDPNSFINQPGAPTGPSIGEELPGKISPLIKALLAGGTGYAVSRGLGSAFNGGQEQQGPTQPGPSSLALNPTALNRNLGFQFQQPEYSAGLGGATLAQTPYNIINPQAPMRRFAEGGEVQAVSQGLGSIPMNGRFLMGPGDGMSDTIPASIEGEEPVMLTDGEYIIPAQAVSALGNGSSSAGAKKLDEMVKRVYHAQTGKREQMKPINNRVMPV